MFSVGLGFGVVLSRSHKAEQRHTEVGPTKTTNMATSGKWAITNKVLAACDVGALSGDADVESQSNKP